SELPAPTRGEGTIICTASLLSQASATRTLRIDVPSPLVGEGSSAGRHELTGVRGAPPQAPPDPRVDKPIHNGSSSVPSRSRFGVAISPSSRSSSSACGGGAGGCFALSSAFLLGSSFLPLPICLFPRFSTPAPGRRLSSMRPCRRRYGRR